MSPFRQTNEAKVIRTVSISDDGTIVVDDTVDATWFGVQIFSTKTRVPTVDAASPRRSPEVAIKWLPGLLGPVDKLSPGGRVDVDGITYEILSEPTDVRDGFLAGAKSVLAHPLDMLYEFTGALEEMGGAVVQATIRFSLYTPAESANDVGTYESGQAEAPLDHHEDLHSNRQIHVGNVLYKIVDSVVDLQGAYVRMTIRKSGAQG